MSDEEKLVINSPKHWSKRTPPCRPDSQEDQLGKGKNRPDRSLDHCIERIRRSIMCHADMAVSSVEWIASSHDPENKQLRSNAEVTCVNWDAVESWAHERVLERKKFKLRAGPFETAHGSQESPT